MVPGSIFLTADVIQETVFKTDADLQKEIFERMSK